MAVELSETTLSLGDHASSKRPEAAHAVRWVFPFPAPAATWLESSRVVFGRDAGSDIELPSAQVSRRHAAIARSGPLFLVSDLGSKNGVFVNGRRVGEAALSPGDVLRIGDHVGVFVRAPREAFLRLETLGPGLYGGHLHQSIAERLNELAPTSLPVVLQGDSGTGKERFARALHEWSGRPGPFLAVNCAVYSKSFAPAELFGYRKGAFTGAEQASPGHIRAAEGGTLLLDELSELPLDVQAMLLRVIENREVLPLGETRAATTDVRFVVATQEPLATSVARGRLRADLRARLEGSALKLPALCECREIVPDLFAVLFEKHASKAPELTARDAETLCRYDWPFNIRELDGLVRRLALSHRPGEPLDLDVLHVPSESHAKEPPPSSSTAPSRTPEKSIPGRGSAAPYRAEDLRVLVETLARHAGNITRTASELGISRQKAYRMLEAAQGEGMGGSDDGSR